MFGRLGYQAFSSTENNVDVLAKVIENISNVNSIGYKKGEVSFFETLSGEVSKCERKNFSQGPLRKTGDLYDLALEGPGFFEIELTNGQRAYTRAGRFRLNSEGELVTEEGYRLIPEVEQEGKGVVEPPKAEGNELGLNIKVTTPKLSISPNITPEILEDGTVNGINPDTGEKTKIGKINVVAFNNPQGLESIGKSLFLPTQSSGPVMDVNSGPKSATRIKQGYLEYGNVDMTTELMQLSQLRNLIAAQFKVLKAIDKIYEQLHYTVSRSA